MLRAIHLNLSLSVSRNLFPSPELVDFVGRSMKHTASISKGWLPAAPNQSKDRGRAFCCTINADSHWPTVRLKVPILKRGLCQRPRALQDFSLRYSAESREIKRNLGPLDCHIRFSQRINQMRFQRSCVGEACHFCSFI